jgi:DNA-binding NarL/FixJ family response regulator
VRPGDKVRLLGDGSPIGKILEVDGEDLVVEVVPGDMRRWSRRTVIPFVRNIPPRGVTKASSRDLEVARLLAEGAKRDVVAERLRLSLSQVEASRKRAIEAIEEERNRRAG